MAVPEYTHLDRYIRGGLGTDHEPGLEIPGLSILEDKYIFAKKVESSMSVNANSCLGEPPHTEVQETIKKVFDFYGTKSFSWIIKSNKEHTYLKNALSSAGIKPEKEFYGMYLPLEVNCFESIAAPDFSIVDAKNKEKISDVVDLTCEIFGQEIGEREDMIKERMSILSNPSNRSGFQIAYVKGNPVGYSRYRISLDRKAMYLTGSGVNREFRGKHIYISLLKHRYELAKKKGCKLLTVFARGDTTKPILEKMGFKTEGKYLFMTRRLQP